MTSRKHRIDIIAAFVLIFCMSLFVSNAHAEEITTEEMYLSLGAISSTNGQESSANNRARTSLIDLDKSSVTINVGDTNSKYGVFFYDKIGSFIGWTNWKTVDSFDIPENTKYARIVMAYRDSKNITDSDLIELNSCILLVQNDPAYTENIPTFLLGGISTSNGQESSSNNRCRTTIHNIETEDISISLGTVNAKYGVFFYDVSGTFLGWTNWLTTDTFEMAEDTQYIRILVGYRDNRDIDENGLAELNSCFSITEKRENEEPETPLEISVGGVNYLDGKNIASTNRARTEYYDMTQTNITVNVGTTGSKYAVFFYDENRTYLGWTNWKTTGEYEAAEGTKYARLVIGYTNSREIDENGLIELNKCFSITEKGGSEEPETPMVISVGGVNFIDGKNLASTNRARTEYYDMTQTDVTVNVGTTGSKYGVFFYDENRTYLGWTNWKTTGEYEAAEGTKYARLVIGYTDNHEIDENGLTELNKCFSITKKGGSEEPEEKPEEPETPLVISVGGVNYLDGKNIASTNRARTEYYDMTQTNITVNVGTTGSKYAVFFYDENRTYLGWTNWKTTGENEAAEGTKYARLVIGYTNSREIDENGLIELNKCFSITEKGGSEEPETPLEISVGGVNYLDGKNIASTNRARTEYYDMTQTNITVNVGTTGSKYAVFFYDENRTYLGWTNWKTTGEYEAAEGTKYVRLVIGYTDNREISSEDLTKLNGCISLTEVVQPSLCGDSITWSIESNTLTLSGSGAMYNYDSADDVPWSANRDKIEYIVLDGEITAIGDYAFAFFTNLQELKLPSSVTQIGKYSFYQCSNIVGTIDGTNITILGDYAFNNCSNIEAVTFGENITILGDYSFDNCSNLTSITFARDLTIIGDVSFTNCQNLTTITIADNVVVLADSNIEMSDCTSVTISQDTVYVNSSDGESVPIPVVPIQAVKVTDVGLDTNEIEMTIGQEGKKLIAIIVPSDATNQNVTWKSSDDSIVKVDENGNLTALKEGTVTVTVVTEDGEYSASATITVTSPVSTTYTVTYDAGVGVFADGNHSKVDSTSSGSYTLLTEQPTREGFVFTGWLLDDTEIGEAIEVNQDVILVAGWKKDAALVIVSNPENQTCTEGELVTFTATAGLQIENTVQESDEVTYQWQVCNSSNSVWTDIPDANSNTYSIQGTIEINGYQYRLVVTYDNGRQNLCTDAATITVKSAGEDPNPGTGSGGLDNPEQDITDVSISASCDFFIINMMNPDPLDSNPLWIYSQVSGTADTSKLEYEWEESFDGETWTAAMNENETDSSTFYTHITMPQTMYYRLVVGGVASNVVTINVDVSYEGFCEYGCPGPEHEPGCPYYTGDVVFDMNS